MPFDSRTRATLRSAEFGFLGVMVFTCRHTPRFCGQPCMAGCFGRLRCGTRGLRTNWLMVGIPTPEAEFGRRCYSVVSVGQTRDSRHPDKVATPPPRLKIAPGENTRFAARRRRVPALARVCDAPRTG